MTPAERTPMDKRAAGSGRTITITLRLPTAVSGLIILCAGFIAVFSLGILLGRGYDIEGRIPQLERIMPQAAHPEQPSVVAQDQTRSIGQSTDSAPGGTEPAAGGSGSGQDNTAARTVAAPSHPPSDPRGQVMGQGDLAYRDSLKQRQRPSGQKQGAARQEPSGGKTATTAREKTGSAKQTQPEGAAGKQNAFAYVYQVAAYKDAAMSDKLAARLKAAGIRARTEKFQGSGSTWYRTVVDFRGSPDDTDGLRAKLKAQGLTRLILKSKTPAR